MAHKVVRFLILKHIFQYPHMALLCENVEETLISQSHAELIFLASNLAFCSFLTTVVITSW